MSKMFAERSQLLAYESVLFPLKFMEGLSLETLPKDIYMTHAAENNPCSKHFLMAGSIISVFIAGRQCTDSFN